jgi:hypothetical protein
VPTPASAGRLGRFFSINIPKKLLKNFGNFVSNQSLHSYPFRYFMTMNDNSKITLVESSTCEAPVVKEEPHEEEDTNHCFVYDMAKSRGG